MSYGLEDVPILLDGNSFDGFKNTETGLHYFAERIAVDGILNFGLVPKDTEVRINLADNGITSPLIIDRVIAIPTDSLVDAIIFYLYRKVGNELILLGYQWFDNEKMPIDYPDGIVSPDMVIGVKPVRADATVVVYAKPVKILFEAVPNPPSS